MDGLLVTVTLNNHGVILIGLDATGAAKVLQSSAFELAANLLGDNGTAGEDRNILQHRLAPITEARGLHGEGIKGTTQLVDDQRRQSLTINILGDDEEILLAAAQHRFKDRQQILDRADLLVGNQDVGFIEHRLHTSRVGDEVGRDITTVKLHTLDQLVLEMGALTLLDRHDAVATDLIHHGRQ